MLLQAKYMPNAFNEGQRYVPERTMYRNSRSNGWQKLRRQICSRNIKSLSSCNTSNQLGHGHDKIKRPVKMDHFYLYNIIDVFSRFVVGWMVAHRESASLAEDLIADTMLKQEIKPAINNPCRQRSSMTSVTVGQLLPTWGFTKTFSSSRFKW